MPGLARLYLRTSLAYLLLGGILGGLLLWNKGATLSPNLWALLAAHIAAMLWGWLLLLSALGQVAALALFGIFMWPRIRPLGR